MKNIQLASDLVDMGFGSYEKCLEAAN